MTLAHAAPVQCTVLLAQHWIAIFGAFSNAPFIRRLLRTGERMAH